MSWEYVLSSIAWSVAGFVIGYFTARTSRDVRRIRQAVAPEERPVNHRPDHGASPRALGVLLVLLALSSVVSIVVFNMHRADVLKCQAEINLDLIAAVHERAAIGDRDREALDDLIMAVFASANMPEKQRERVGRQAMQNYVETIAESKAARERVVLPNPAMYDCGEVT